MLNLAWEIEITEKAAKQIKKLGTTDAKRIRDYLRDRIAQLDHPRQLGKPLQGSELGSYWRYRVGDYRILCELHDDELVVLVIEAGHRRKIYG
jgi:mRNA interferase RelE/StbE